MPKSALQTSHPKKERFIELYGEARTHITDLCRAVGIGRKTYYDWLDKDPEFAMRIAEAESEVNDDMKKALIEKGGEGDLGTIIFWLKMRHPEFKMQNNTYIQDNRKIDKIEFIIDEN